MSQWGFWERCLCLLSDRATVTPSYPYTCTCTDTMWTPASAPDSDWPPAVSHHRSVIEPHMGTNKNKLFLLSVIFSLILIPLPPYFSLAEWERESVSVVLLTAREQAACVVWYSHVQSCLAESWQVAFCCDRFCVKTYERVWITIHRRSEQLAGRAGSGGC